MNKIFRYFFAIVIIFSSYTFAINTNSGNNYYVDSQHGDDSNSGTSINSPWKSLKNLESFSFQPGDTILFKTKSVFTGGINFTASGNKSNSITISKYGKGASPSFSNPKQDVLNGNVFQLSGSYINIDGLAFSSCANAGIKNGKSVLQVGAIFTKVGANYVTIKNCEFIDCPIGVNFTGEYSLITNCKFRDCNRFLSEPDWGPIGIVIGNANNEISYNSCKNYVKIGGNYGADGGFIELDDRFFGVKVHDIKIHHNRSFDNMGFLEIESKIEGDNLDVYYNLSNDYQQFIFYWGGNNSKIENNTVIRTKPSLNGAVNTVFTMRNGNFTLKNNIFVVANGLQVLATAPYDEGNYDHVIHENNLYYCTDGSSDDPCGKPLGAGEIIANPNFVDIINGDYHLSSNSPAINSGVDLGYKFDFDKVPIEKKHSPSMGVFQKSIK